MTQQKKRFATDNSRFVLFLEHLRLLTAEANQKLIGGLSIKTQKTWIAPEERYQPRNTQIRFLIFLFSYLAQSGFNNANFWIIEGGQFTHFWNSIRWFVCRKSSHNLLTPNSTQVTWKYVPAKKSGRLFFRRLERVRGGRSVFTQFLMALSSKYSSPSTKTFSWRIFWPPHPKCLRLFYQNMPFLIYLLFMFVLKIHANSTKWKFGQMMLDKGDPEKNGFLAEFFR